MNDEIAALVARLLPGTAVGRIRLLGEGTDHVTHEVDGTLVVRRARQPAGDTRVALEREVALLQLVATVSPIPVPEVVASDAERGVLVLRKLEGTSLLDRPSPHPEALADQLAALLDGLRGVDASSASAVVDRDRYPLARFLDDARGELATIAPHLGASERQLVEAFLESVPPPESGDEVLCHNDLGAEHLLASPDGARLTGVLDWSDAALCDPARDLARLYRDLGPLVVQQVLDRCRAPSGEQVRERAAFLARCALVEDLAYGLGDGPARYAEAARRHLRRTFDVDPL